MDLADIFEIGWDVSHIRGLAIIKAEVHTQGKWLLLDALKEIKTILEEQEIAEETVRSLTKRITQLEKDYPRDNTELSSEHSDILQSEVEVWRREIRKALGTKSVITIELQSGLNPNELRKVADQMPSEFISKQIWEKMTEIEKSDLSDAAKCLLLGTATPSVMVALRGAEACVRNFYKCKTKTDPGEKTWRQLTSELKARADDLGISGSFIGYLDYIGEAKRNFAQHPNKTYSLREAPMIFMQVVSLIEDTYIQI